MAEELNSIEGEGQNKRKKIIIFGGVVILLCCCVSFFGAAWFLGDSVVSVMCEQLGVLCR